MKKISTICTILIVGAVLFLGYYHILQPYLSEQITDKYRDLYHAEETDSGDFPEISVSTSSGNEPGSDLEPTISGSVPDSETSTPETNDKPANYMKFEALIDKNIDICGWITVPGTNIDYPVVSASEDKTDYYLTHNIDGEEDKNGSLFIDYRTELIPDSKVLVINGHNMKSTGLMFHELTKYKNLEFYKQNPVFTFDTIHEDARWKIIALIRTNNNEKHGERLNYFIDEFSSDAEFLDYVYQLKLRSVFHCPVTVNESDSLLILSTCTYEMNDMRFLVVARKLREGEGPSVDTSLSYKEDRVLYPDAWYEMYGGSKPDVTSFAEAYEAGEIAWYDGTIFESP